MPNLLVIQHLEILYLGGNHVRVMCEKVWRIAQDCAKKQGLAAGSCGWLAAASRQNDAHVPSMPEAEASCQLLHYKTKVLGWPGHLLAAWTCDSTQSQGQVARTSCLGKTDFSHSFSPYYIYTFIPTILWELPERIWERNSREKQDWLIHNLYLRDLLPKLFLTISIYVRGLSGALGSS